MLHATTDRHVIDRWRSTTCCEKKVLEHLNLEQSKKGIMRVEGIMREGIIRVTLPPDTVPVQYRIIPVVYLLF